MVLHLPLYHPQEEGDESLYRPSHPIHYLYKVHDDHHRTNQEGHLPGSLGSHTGHQVTILPHPNSRKIPMFSPIQAEKYYIPVQDLSFQLMNSSRDFYKNYKSPLTPLLKEGNNSVSVSGCCSYSGRTMHQDRTDGWRVASSFQKLAFILNQDKCQFDTSVHSPRSYIQHQGDDHLITQGWGTGNKSWSYKGSFIANIQGHDETAGTDQLFKHGSPSSKASLTSPPVVTEWNVQVSSWSFQTSKVYTEVQEALLWWHSCATD